MSDLVKDRTSIKLNTKAAIDKIKFGSPELKQVLRQRCREKLREKRGELFNARRLGFTSCDNEIIQKKLHDIVRKEISDITTMDIDYKTNIFNNEPLTYEESIELERELLVEEEQWILDEYDKMEENEEKKWSFYGEHLMETQVICPICEKAIIKESPSGLSCRVCQLNLPPTMSLEQFARSLEQHMLIHSKKCPERPSFEAIADNNTVELYFACQDCLSFAIIR